MNSSSGSRARGIAAARGRLAGLALALAAAIGQAAAQPAEPLRPEIGRPLLAAQELVKAQRFKEALAKVREADAVGGRNAHESFMIERMRIAAAAGAGDAEAASRAFEIMSGMNRLAPAEKTRMIESIASGHYRARDFGAAVKWAQRYFREGGSSAAMRTLLVQSQIQGGDFAGALRELTAEVQAAERSGTAPDEDTLRLLLHAAAKAGDAGAQASALERLVAHHPRPEYWADLLARLQRKPGFPDRLALDVLRLSFATGHMTAASDHMELAQMAVQAGLPAEAKRVLDSGFASGVLGVGPQAERHRRLLELVEQRLAADRSTAAEREREALAAGAGDALVTLGMAHVAEGRAARGVQLIGQALARGGLKRPEDARLQLGIAQWAAGDLTKALATFRSFTGTGGTADLARLWALHARRRG